MRNTFRILTHCIPVLCFSLALVTSPMLSKTCLAQEDSDMQEAVAPTENTETGIDWDAVEPVPAPDSEDSAQEGNVPAESDMDF